MKFLLAASFSALLAAASVVAAAPAHFLLVSGVTAVDENCLVASGTGVWLESCEAAVASAQGKEIWSLATDGSLVHASSKKCLSASGSTDLSPLELAPCDAAGVAKWELQANGQVKMSQSNMCVSQLGSANAALNIAAAASASASSTLDPSHGAALAIDGLASTYWVSKMDVAGGVTLLLDFGEAVRGSVLELDFEFVPSAFAVQAASPGSVWRQIFATDSNVLKHVRIPLEAEVLSGIKLVMQTAHPTLGSLNGRKLFGVRSARVMARPMQPALVQCATAGKSVDGRDKYFPVAVSGFDPQAAAALAAELPALESADAALSAVALELAEALPAITTCKPAAATLLNSNATVRQLRQKVEQAASSLPLDVSQESALLQEAKATVLAVRSLLA